MKSQLAPLGFLLFLCLAAQAQIPGFIEKWRVDLGTTNTFTVGGIGRDGSTLVSAYDNEYVSASGNKFTWVSPAGEVLGRMAMSEFTAETPRSGPYYAVVLVAQSNLIVQTAMGMAEGGNGTMTQITQINRSNSGALQITKTKISTGHVNNGRDAVLSDFSCPERLMFVQQGSVLVCYRPAADIATPLNALTLNSLSPSGTELLVTSSTGGQVRIQGTTNLTNWETLTNVQTTPGITRVTLPVSQTHRFFYRSVMP